MGKKKTPEGVVSEVMDYIKKLPRKEIVKIGGKFLELFFWVDDVPMKPEGWDEMGDSEKLRITSAITDEIGNLVGRKTILRYWYVNVRGHSKKEFKKYWNSMPKKTPSRNFTTLVHALVGYGAGSLLADIITLIIKIVQIAKG